MTPERLRHGQESRFPEISKGRGIHSRLLARSGQGTAGRLEIHEIFDIGVDGYRCLALPSKPGVLSSFADQDEILKMPRSKLLSIRQVTDSSRVRLPSKCEAAPQSIVEYRDCQTTIYRKFSPTQRRTIRNARSETREIHQGLVRAERFWTISISARLRLGIHTVPFENPSLAPVTQTDVEYLPKPHWNEL